MEIFENTKNAELLGVKQGTWASWKSRFIEGTLKESTQIDLLTKLGYSIAIERKWASK